MGSPVVRLACSVFASATAVPFTISANASGRLSNSLPALSVRIIVQPGKTLPSFSIKLVTPVAVRKIFSPYDILLLTSLFSPEAKLISSIANPLYDADKPVAKSFFTPLLKLQELNTNNELISRNIFFFMV